MKTMKKFKLAEDMEGFGKAGEVIEMAVTPAESGDQDRVIDSYLGGYSNQQLCADQISPPVIVNQEKGTRIDFSKENAFQHVPAGVGRNGALKEVEHLNERTSYQTQEYGLASFVSWGSQNDSVPQLDLKRATATMLMQKVLLDREIRVKTDLTTTANWDAANTTTLTSGQKWNGGASADPLADIQARLAASAMRVDMMVMNPDVAAACLKDTEIRAFLRQVHGDDRQADAVIRAASYSQDAEVIKLAGLPDILICPAKVLNESTGALDYIWPNDVVFLSKASGMSEVEIATHMTFRHRGSSGNGIIRNEWIPMDRGLNKGVMLEVGFGEDTFFPSNICGGHIKDAVQ